MQFREQLSNIDYKTERTQSKPWSFPDEEKENCIAEKAELSEAQMNLQGSA